MISESPTYRSFGIAATPLPGMRVLVSSRISGITRAITVSQYSLLQFCEYPRTVGEHVAAYISAASEVSQTRASAQGFCEGNGGGQDNQKNGIYIPSSHDVTALLEQFIAQGLLLSDNEIQEALLGAPRRSLEAPVNISSVGVPTCNRPDLLLRLLTSIGQDCERHGEDPLVLISDDSTSKAGTAANGRVISQMRRRMRVTHLDRPRRKLLATMLASAAGADISTVEFAVVGDERLGPTYGASRNTLLLCAAGTLSLQSDDDLIWRMVPMPARPPEPRLSLDATSHVVDYWFNRDLASDYESISDPAISVLSAHARLLGRSVQDCIVTDAQDGLDLTHMSYALYRRAALPSSHIGITSMGIAGASGATDVFHRLFLTGSSRERMLQSELTFARALVTDSMVRAPRCWCISDGQVLMAAGTGFDLRTPLPPFPPSFRNEDGVFGAVARTTAPEVLQGLVPCVIVHKPPDARAHSGVLTWHMRANDILRRLVYQSVPRPLSIGEACNLEQLGSVLVALAGMPRQAFREVIHVVFRAASTELLFEIRSKLDEERVSPPYWANKLLELQASITRALTHSTASVFADVPGDINDRYRSMQSYIGRYGELLQCWEGLFHVARSEATECLKFVEVKPHCSQ